MIFRPRIDTGELEEFETKITISKSSIDATADDFEKIEAGMGLMIGIDAHHALDLAGVPHNTAAVKDTDGLTTGGSSSGDAAPGEVKVTLLLGNALYERLNKKRIALGKANKASERIADATLRVSDKSLRFSAAIRSCTALQEQAMKLEAELSFLIKFKKTMDGEEITAALGEEYINNCTDIINDMYEEAKVIKTLTAKPKKQDD